MSEQPKNNNLAILIMGVIIGVSLTYMLTTKKGQKIKDQLLAEGKKFLEDLADRAEELEEEVVERQEEIQGKVKEVSSEVRQEAKQLTEDIPTHIEQIQKKGRRFFFKRHQPQES